MRTVLFILLCALMVTPVQAVSRITGIVLDVSGAPIPNATVTVGTRSLTTGPDGRFEVADAPDGENTIEARADGFAPTNRRVVNSADDIRLILQPAPLVNTVVVTASRGTEQLATPSGTSVLTSAEILNAGAGALDDVLRNTPGFSLFRRSSSRVANPTTQGVTLRGVSGSGASRTMVLADGQPLNDAFGSWVYWNRIPMAAIERVEVVRGAAGDLYGADALGGVIQVLTFAPAQRRLRLTMDGGTQGTARFSGYGSGQRKGWDGFAAGEWLRSDGAFTVGEEVRGPVDIKADSDYATGFAGGGYDAGRWHGTARVSFYDENRNNGTPRQVNSTDWTQVSAEAGGSAASGAWLARASGGTQEYYQTFSAVSTDRTSERLTTEQTTPSDFMTVSGQWTRSVGQAVLLAGAEGKRTDSRVEEIRYSVTNVRTGPFYSGGIETSGAVFGRASVRPHDAVTVVFGGRADFWRSKPDDVTLERHEANFFSPRVSAEWKLGESGSIHAAVYRAYRTPTLNELHRGFRTGNIVTNPNAGLDPERLTGFEGGVLWRRAVTSARVTAFWTQLNDAITNVTIATTATQITRQRQNTDTVRSAGVELEADYRPLSRWMFTGLAVLTRARFEHTPEQTELEGNRVPQVPSFQFGGTVTYLDPHGFTGSVQARALGAQFDDDLNAYKLNGYGVVDASASQELMRGVHLFAAVENVFDVDYDTGRTPQRTVGWPRSFRMGVRIFLP